MELAGRYLSSFNTDLMSLQPPPEEVFPFTPFSSQGQISSQRPYRTPAPITFMYPSAKGPGF